MSGVLCAVGGVFYVQYFLYVGPRSVFGEMVSVQILIYAIVGGLGTTWGPVVGAVLLVPLSRSRARSSATPSPGSQLLLYGAVMVLTMLFMPYGIIGLAQSVCASAGSTAAPRKWSTAKGGEAS